MKKSIFSALKSSAHSRSNSLVTPKTAVHYQVTFDLEGSSAALGKPRLQLPPNKRYPHYYNYPGTTV
jgi:hypothetical protein